MKTIVTIVLLSALIFTGCSQKSLNKNNYQMLWNDYIQREFEESFVKEQSSDQRKKIIEDLATQYGYSLENVKSYMKKNHADKYSKIFIY